MIDSDGDTYNVSDNLIQEIRPPEIGLVRHFGYDVRLNTGQWVSGVKESDLKTYPKFAIVAAMQGVTCVDGWYYGPFSALKRATWCRMIARAIQRGQQKAKTA